MTETGQPVVTMTKWQYIALWGGIGIAFMLAARWFLVQPIVEACR